MNELLNSMQYIFFSILTLYTYHLFFRMTLTFKSSKKKLIYLGYSGYFIVTATSYFTVNRTWLNLTIGVVGLWLLTQVYGGNQSRKLIICLITVIFMALFEVMVTNIYALVTSTELTQIMADSNTTFFLYALSKLMPFLLLKYYCYFKRNEEIVQQEGPWPFGVTLQLIIIPLLSMMVLHVLYCLVQALETQQAMVMLMLGTFSIIIINIILFNLYEQLVRKHQQTLEQSLLTKQIEYYKVLYETIGHERREAFKLRHNMKHELLNIRTLLMVKSNQLAVEGIDQILEMNHSSIEIFSEVPIIDAVLNYKVQEAKLNQIQIHIKASIGNQIKVSSTHLANILGNALDNAIEACKENPDKQERYIEVIIKQEYTNMYLCIMKPYYGEVVLEGQFPLSKKRNNAQFGIGLKTIESILKDNNNSMHIDIQNNRFSLEIILFDAFDL